MNLNLLCLLLIAGFSNAGYLLNDCFVHNIIMESPYHDCWTPVDWQLVENYPNNTMSLYAQKSDAGELYFTVCSTDNCTGECYEIDETLKYTNYCMPRQGNNSVISWLLSDSDYYSAFDTVRWWGTNYGHPCISDCFCNSSYYCVGCYEGLWGEGCNETCNCTDTENSYCDRYTGECTCYIGHQMTSSGTCEQLTCNHKCACDLNNECQLCFPGWWGPGCLFECSLDCDGGSCDMENGDCDEGDDATYATCKVSDWSDWSDCSNQCNGGVRSRTRSVEYVYPVNITCPDTAEHEICNAQSCPVLKFQMTGDASDVETNIVSALSEYVSSTVRYSLLCSQTSGSIFTSQVIFYYDTSATQLTYTTLVGYVESGLMDTVESSTGYSIVEDSIYINGVNIFQDGEDIYLTAIIFLGDATCNDTFSDAETQLSLVKKNYEQFNSASLTISVDNCTDLSTGDAEMIISMLINPDVDSMSTVTGDNELEGNEEAALSFLDYFSTNSEGLMLLEESLGVEITVGGKIENLYTDYTGSGSSSSTVIILSVVVGVLAVTTALFLVLWRKSAPVDVTQGDYSYSRM